MKFLSVFEQNAEFSDTFLTFFGADVGYFLSDTAAIEPVGNEIDGFFRSECSAPDFDCFLFGKEDRKTFFSVKVKNKCGFDDGMSDKLKIIGNIIETRPIITIAIAESFEAVVYGGFYVFATQEYGVSETPQSYDSASSILFQRFLAFLRIVKNHCLPSVSDA